MIITIHKHPQQRSRSGISRSNKNSFCCELYPAFNVYFDVREPLSYEGKE